MESSGPNSEGAGQGLGEAWSQIAAIVTAVDTSLGKWLMDNYGIGLSEYRAAQHLSVASGRELRITELAHAVGLSQSSVTRLVGRLEIKNLAFRDTCPDDGRGVFAVITDHGLEVLREIREPYEVKIAELLRHAARHYPQLNLTGLDRSFGKVGTLIS